MSDTPDSGGPDPDDLEFDELPGMEPDEAPEVEAGDSGNSQSEPPQAQDPGGDSSAKTTEPEWTDGELNEWYDSARLGSMYEGDTSPQGKALTEAMQTAYGAMNMNDDALFRIGDDPEYGDWHRLGPELKAQYRRWAESSEAPPGRPPEKPDDGWVDDGYYMTVTMPDGSHRRVYQDDGTERLPHPQAKDERPFGPVPFWKSSKPIIYGSTAAIVAAAGFWFFSQSGGNETTSPPPATAAEQTVETAAPVIKPSTDDQADSGAAVTPSTPVRSVSTTMEMAELWSCADNTFISSATDVQPVRATLLIGQPGANGATPIVSIFGPGLVQPASGVVSMRDGSKQSGFASQGADSFCNFSASSAKSPVLDCDGTFVASDSMPSDPTLAEDFGVTFYQPDSSDPSQYATYGSSLSDVPIEEGLIQIEPGGHASISFSADGEAEAIPSLAACEGSAELENLLQTLAVDE